MTKWAFDEDRIYHGIDEGGAGRILVERTEFGPTRRQRPVVLRELVALRENRQLDWGYDGTGPHRTAQAVLADALGQVPADEMRNAFCMDVIAHLVGEWWLRRGAVLRWVRGWCAEHQVDVLPGPVASLPPVHPLAYERAPEHLHPQHEAGN